MPSRPFALLLLLVLLPLPAAHAVLPDLRVRRFTVDDGLSQSDVQAIVRDRRGFLWIGTQDGLNRFDGYGFVVYRHTPADSQSISDDAVWSLCAAKDGSLWIGTFAGGLNRYDPATGQFTSYLHDPGDPGSLSWNNITAVVEDPQGRIWAGSWGGGLNLLDRRTGKFTRYMHDSANAGTIPGNRVYSLAVTPSGKIWVGTWEGLGLLDPANGSVKRLPRVAPGGRTLTEVQSLLAVGDTAVWVGTQKNGLFHVDTRRWIAAPRKLAEDEKEGNAHLSVRGLMQDGRGTLWVATGGSGLVRLETSTGEITISRNSQSNPRSLGYDALSVVYRQQDGLVWIGTTGAGLNLYDPREERFALLSVHGPPGAVLSHNLARAFFEDAAGHLWVATSGGGITVLGPDRHTARYFGQSAGDRSGLRSRYVHALAGDAQGRVWAGTASDGLWRWDPRAERFTEVRYREDDPQSPSSDMIGALMTARDGALWVGHMGAGLERRDLVRGTSTRWRRRAGDSTGLSGDFIFSLLESSRGEVWVGTWGQGISRFDPRTGTFRWYLHAPADTHSLPGNTVNAIHEDRQGRIWVGTAGGGLATFDRVTERFSSIAEPEGLPNDVVYGILEDAHGRLWVSTNRGIARVDPATRSIRTFDAADGLQGNEFNLGAAFAGRDGRFHFGGVNGVTVFHPDSVRDDAAAPSVALTSFRVFDRPVHLDTLITSAAEIVLDYPQNFFSFEFSALDFSAPEKARYAYRMEGFDRDWVAAGGRRYASYTNLDAGTYIFRVRGANGDGVWGPGGASVRVTITPPFWSTWWFRVLGVLAAAAAVTVVVRRQVNRVRRERKVREVFARGLLHSEERERSRIAGELHDSLMQSLLIAKNRALLALLRPEDVPTLKEGLEEIAGVMTGALDEVRRIAHNLRPYQLDRLGLTKALQSLAATAGESSGVRFATDLDELDAAFTRDDATLVYRILQEAVNNILKHSGATEAHIHARRGPKEVVITVHDNGKGMGAAGKDPRGLGFGMSGIGERIRMLGGAMSVESGDGKGTTLRFRVPNGRRTGQISGK